LQILPSPYEITNGLSSYKRYEPRDDRADGKNGDNYRGNDFAGIASWFVTLNDRSQKTEYGCQQPDDSDNNENYCPN
jgi:hypothetical protein